jgi:ABC-2 type transport system permease protein
MRKAWYITTKELLENRRDRLAALFTIILPVIFTVFLGLILSSSEVSTLPLAVADADGSPVSRRLVERLQASPLLNLHLMQAGEVDAAVERSQAAAGLVIPSGYGASLERGEPLSLDFIWVETSSGAQSVQQAVNGAMSGLSIELLAARAAAESVAARTSSSADALRVQAEPLVQASLEDPLLKIVEIDTTGSADGPATGFNQSSTGGLIQWVLFGLIGTASMTVWERRRGLLRRLSVAGIRAPQVVGGKMMAMLIVTFLQQLLLVLLGQLAFGVDYFSSPLALLLIMVSLSVFAASFGLLISVLFRSEQAVIATTVISAQLLAALGGAWFPLEITSASFSKVAHFLPTAWVMDALHGITLKGWGVADILLPLGVVWAWVVVVFGLAVLRYRPQ